MARYIPFVGSAVAASISFTTTYTMGRMLLDQIKAQAAQEIERKQDIAFLSYEFPLVRKSPL